MTIEEIDDLARRYAQHSHQLGFCEQLKKTVPITKEELTSLTDMVEESRAYLMEAIKEYGGQQ